MMTGGLNLNQPHNECKVLRFAIILRFIIQPLDATAVRTLGVSTIAVSTLHCNIAYQSIILFHLNNERDTRSNVMVFFDPYI